MIRFVVKKTWLFLGLICLLLFCIQVSAENQKNEYDENGRVTKTVYEDGSYETYTYDENGNLISTQYYKEDVTEGLGDSGVEESVTNDSKPAAKDDKSDDSGVDVGNDGATVSTKDNGNSNYGESDDGTDAKSERGTDGTDGSNQNDNPDKTNREDYTNGTNQNQGSNGYDSGNEGNQNREQNNGTLGSAKKTGDDARLGVIWTIFGLSFLLISALIIGHFRRRGRFDR